MRSSHNIEAKSNHLRIISIIHERKNATTHSEELPDCTSLPLLRQNAISIFNNPIAVYMIKQNKELLVNLGQFSEPLEQKLDLIHLGTDPMPCMPMNAHHAFQCELQSASHAFFQRPEVRQMLQEKTPIYDDLIEIIVQYR